MRTSLIRLAGEAIENEISEAIDDPEQLHGLRGPWVVIDAKNETAQVVTRSIDLKNIADNADSVVIVLDVAKAARQLVLGNRRFTIPNRSR